MSKQIFINLPVHDLAKAKAFYTALGYSINPNSAMTTRPAG